MDYRIKHSIVREVAISSTPVSNIDKLFKLSNQISSGYFGIIRQHILPNIPHKAKIRIRELRILKYMYASDDAVVAHEITKFTGFDAATVSRAVSRLVKLEMVEKKISFRDKRTNLLKLSATGRKLVKSFVKIESKIQESLINRPDLKITTREYDQFLRISKKLLGRIVTIDHTCTVLDKEFCRNCIQSQQNPPSDWVKARTECWPCDKYNFSKKSFVERKI